MNDEKILTPEFIEHAVVQYMIRHPQFLGGERRAEEMYRSVTASLRLEYSEDDLRLARAEGYEDGYADGHFDGYEDGKNA